MRALSPHIGANVELADGTLLGVHAARVPALGGRRRAARRAIVSLDGELPVLGCAEGALELVSVQPAGRRPMGGEDFLRGLRR